MITSQSGKTNTGGVARSRKNRGTIVSNSCVKEKATPRSSRTLLGRIRVHMLARDSRLQERPVEEGVDCLKCYCMDMLMRAATMSAFWRKRAEGARSRKSRSASPDFVLTGECLMFCLR